jgi:PEP-CTERM motif
MSAWFWCVRSFSCFAHIFVISAALLFASNSSAGVVSGISRLENINFSLIDLNQTDGITPYWGYGSLAAQVYQWADVYRLVPDPNSGVVWLDSAFRNEIYAMPSSTNASSLTATATAASDFVSVSALGETQGALVAFDATSELYFRNSRLSPNTTLKISFDSVVSGYVSNQSSQPFTYEGNEILASVGSLNYVYSRFLDRSTLPGSQWVNNQSFYQDIDQTIKAHGEVFLQNDSDREVSFSVILRANIFGVSTTSENSLPEPGTLILAAAALLGLGVARRKRSQPSA